MRAVPVELYLERDHAFKKKAPDPVTGKKRIGCEACGRAKQHRAHMGAPPSMNEGGSGMDRMAFKTFKRAWQSAFVDLIAASGLDACEAVSVEVEVGYSSRGDRDGGNVKWWVEKVLGDALVEAGILHDDTYYPVDRYDVGSITGVHSPGRSWLRLRIFPRAAVVAPMGAKGTVPETEADQLALGGGVG